MVWKCLELVTWAMSLRSKARQGNRLSSKFDLCQSSLSQNLSCLTSVQNVLLGWGVFSGYVLSAGKIIAMNAAFIKKKKIIHE